MFSTTVVIGGQWGDEGKGKIVDHLASSFDLVVRYQGGCNAGHTVKIDDKTYKLNLVPSGVLTPGVVSVIGNGVVIDPHRLKQEIESLTKQGVLFDNFFISENAHVTMHYHKLIESAEEEQKGSNKIGTTGRGIGPTYADKISRIGVTMKDLSDIDRLSFKLKNIIPIKNKILEEVYGVKNAIKFDEFLFSYSEIGSYFSKFLIDASVLVNDAIDSGKKVLFEGAQGALLDVDHGDYPYVTSSNTVSGAVCTGVGVGPNKIKDVIGVFKAYATRVGNGPFPTELFNNECELIRSKGGEFGTTTGRPRRCGWFDGVLAKKSIRINGVNALSITKLDVLNGFEKVKFCVEYDDFDMPIYREFAGWDSIFDENNNINKQVSEYIGFMEDFLGVKVHSFGYGQSREDIFIF